MVKRQWGRLAGVVLVVVVGGRLLDCDTRIE